MPCNYSQPIQNLTQLDLKRFGYLGNSHVIRHWFQRGWQMRAAAFQDCFEPFIFTWIALNAWGECVTKQERDEDWVRSLANDQTLNERFSHFLKMPAANGIIQSAEQFCSRWPIPRVQVWRRYGPDLPKTQSVHD